MPRLFAHPLVLVLALASAASAQEPVDALSAGARRLYLEARQLERAGDLDGAATRYRAVLKADPEWLQAVVDLGGVLEAQGDRAGAAATYRRAPFYSDAVFALGRLLLEDGSWKQAAAQFAKASALEPGSPRFLIYEARAIAGTDPRRAAAVFEDFLERPGAELAAGDGPALALGISEALVASGDEALGRAVIERAIERLESEGADDAGLREAWAWIEVQDEARMWMRAAERPLTRDQGDRLAEARADLRGGRPERAREAIEALLQEAPNSAAAHGALADALLDLDEVPAAERQARIAEQLDPLESVHAARLGAILYERYSGRYDQEAAAAYARALARPSAPVDLWFDRGQAELRAGMGAQAARSFRRYLELAPEGRHGDRAREIIDGLALERLDLGQLRTPDRLPGVDESAQLKYWTAQVLARPPRGSPADLDRAIAELDPVLVDRPDFVPGLVLRAEIAVARDEPTRAIALYERALAAEPELSEVMPVLARLLEASGDPDGARRWLIRAAELGEPRTLVRLAREDLQGLRLLSARARLERFRLRATPAADEVEAEALELQRAVDLRLRGIGAAGALLGATALGLPLLARARSRSGESLDALIERSPRVWPDVARVLSAIRHEVLKHHTTVLDAVAHELEVGDPGIGAWAADRLHDAIDRFRTYVGQLEQLGRMHGATLNLRHRDPVFGPMVAAMDGLERLLPALREGRSEAAPELREQSAVLNDRGYRALGGTLRRLCLLPLREEMFRSAWDSVRKELRSEARLELALPEAALRLRLFRGELDDILVNLLRNALEASSEGQEPRVGVRVALEVDPITGLERVAIRVRDNAPRRISTAMIRGRYIGRGLGLAVDLISRNGGSIHVEPEEGWAKAVVVRLPSAEAPDLEDG